MKVFLEASVLGQMIGTKIEGDWIAFLDCPESYFRTDHLVGSATALDQAISDGRVMFRDDSKSPLAINFEAFLSRHGFTISWSTYAGKSQYSRASAAAVIALAQKDNLEGLENLKLINDENLRFIEQLVDTEG